MQNSGMDVQGVSRRQFVASASALGAMGACVAGGLATSASAMEPDSTAQPEWDAICDVLVIGFGGAGGCAAIAAADEGAKVLLVDKAPEYLEGGNTRYSEQFLLGWEDGQVGREFLTCMADGREDMTDEILDFMASETLNTPAWIAEHGGELGCFDTIFDSHEQMEKAFAPAQLFDLVNSNWTAQMSDGRWPFFEYASWPNGGGLNEYRVSHSYMVVAPAHHKGYWEWVRKTVEAYSDSIACWFNSPATAIIRDSQSGVVLGATIDHNGESVNVFARSGVVLASGSYEADLGKLETYAERTGYFVGSSYNTGDAIDMAGQIGAKMWHMSGLSGPFVNPPKSDSHQAWWCGGGVNRPSNNGHSIFVTADGKRFIRECGYNHHGFMPMGDTYQNQQLPHKFFAILDAEGFERAGFYNASSYCRVNEDQIVSADTVEELAEGLGVDSAVLAETVANYNSYCEAGFDQEFARWPETMEKIEKAPFYGIEYGAAYVNAQGGPKRNTDCQVVDYNESPIPHLYSAGELGSFWGGIYIAGGNVAETCYTGRVAGRNAAAAKDDVTAPEGLSEPTNEITVFDADALAASYECGEGESIGCALGIHGPIVVKVTLDGETMKGIEVLSQFESPDVVKGLFTDMPQRMVEANSADVDIQAGASIASRGLQDAVKDALVRAGIDISSTDAAGE